MNIDLIREKLAEAIPERTEWLDKLNETEPGNYGVEDSEVILSLQNVFVNIPERTFEFDEAKFSFDLKMGESKDGFDDDFSKTAKGNGTFEFSADGKGIIIKKIEIEVNLDLYA
jgi:hypothetical protein